MRSFILFLAIVIGGGWFLTDAVRSGKLERYLDAHPAQQRNAQIEYHWAFILDISSRQDSALYRYRRVVQKYPETEFAPRAWLAIIGLVDNDRLKVLEESQAFLEKYPQDPEADRIRKKIEVLQQGG